MSRLKLYLFAAIGGALTGLISFAFLRALDWATHTRLAHGWLVWLLPAAGFIVAGSYHYWGGRAKGGTPMVIEQAHTFTRGVPTRMAPMIFGGAVAGHIVGASVGREGAALQMAGSVTDSAARLARLTHDQRRTLIAASLAGGWGAVVRAGARCAGGAGRLVVRVLVIGFMRGSLLRPRDCPRNHAQG
jgi:H+/Cl- antiporter ClcA